LLDRVGSCSVTKRGEGHVMVVLERVLKESGRIEVDTDTGDILCNTLVRKNKNMACSLVPLWCACCSTMCRSVMFVGGPNTREDFHLEEGSEFFFQIRGNMELPTIQKGKRKLVRINEGNVFLLPSRIPHSPQRPEANSLGLVIERERVEGEMDALRFYEDFSSCEKRLWERYFFCSDLGKDLGPVIGEWKASEESKSRTPTNTSLPEKRLIQERTDIEIPEPFNLQEWVDAHLQQLTVDGSRMPLFPGHPDGEFSIMAEGALSETLSEYRSAPNPSLETLIFQLRGTTTVHVQGSGSNSSSNEDEEKAANRTVSVGTMSCFVVGKGQTYKMIRDAGAVCLVIHQDPSGNKA